MDPSVDLRPRLVAFNMNGKAIAAGYSNIADLCGTYDIDIFALPVASNGEIDCNVRGMTREEITAKWKVPPSWLSEDQSCGIASHSTVNCSGAPLPDRRDVMVKLVVTKEQIKAWRRMPERVEFDLCLDGTAAFTLCDEDKTRGAWVRPGKRIEVPIHSYVVDYTRGPMGTHSEIGYEGTACLECAKSSVWPSVVALLRPNDELFLEWITLPNAEPLVKMIIRRYRKAVDKKTGVRKYAEFPVLLDCLPEIIRDDAYMTARPKAEEN